MKKKKLVQNLEGYCPIELNARQALGWAQGAQAGRAARRHGAGGMGSRAAHGRRASRRTGAERWGPGRGGARALGRWARWASGRAGPARQANTGQARGKGAWQAGGTGARQACTQGPVGARGTAGWAAWACMPMGCALGALSLF